MDKTANNIGGFTAEDIALFDAESTRSFRATWAARDAAAASYDAHAAADEEEKAEAQLFMLPRRG